MFVGRCSSDSRRRQNAFDQIRNVAEASGLFPFTVNGDWLAGHRLIHEIRQRASVIQSHARAIRIKNSHDARVHTVIPVIGHGDRFGKSFSLRRKRRAEHHGIYVAPISFRLWSHVRIPVTFRRGRHQKFRALRSTQVPARCACQVKADFQRRNRMLQIIHRACR